MSTINQITVGRLRSVLEDVDQNARVAILDTKEHKFRPVVLVSTVAGSLILGFLTDKEVTL